MTSSLEDGRICIIGGDELKDGVSLQYLDRGYPFEAFGSRVQGVM